MAEATASFVTPVSQALAEPNFSTNFCAVGISSFSSQYEGGVAVQKNIGSIKEDAMQDGLHVIRIVEVKIANVNKHLRIKTAHNCLLFIA
jgi:hypothetical protein